MMAESINPSSDPGAVTEPLVDADEEVDLPYTQYKMKRIPTMFGQISEKNVIFCVDTSGSMYSALDAVKEHLIEVLMQRAEADSDTMFNVIEFSTEVTQWSDKMVRCTPQTVAVATGWIKNLEAKTGTNTMDALMTAFSDPDCDAVAIVTDGHPDQHPTDILDSVGYASQNRPVHCFFIEQGNPDSSAVTFLHDLGKETYGSFHVIAVSLHGSIERISPVYRAEMSAERIVRTTEGNIYPSNHKICTVGTTLNSPLPDVIVEHPSVFSYGPPLYPYHLYPYPYRYFYQCHYPHVGWSRYRSARASLNHGTTYDDYVPGAGAMLIGVDVLARRNADGHFYVGRVKSQILGNKFLVEFGPCKHGKYRDTVYQETFVHDIVSLDDALRHSVFVGEKVLAPWEPEGEKYGPGVVIEGQEKRAADGGGPNEDIVVTFYNGKSAKVPKDTAVWIPYELHERISFELQLPRKVRCEFAEQNTYPEENLPGYPISGPIADPKEFEVHKTGWISRDGPVTMRSGGYIYTPFHRPLYPVYYKNQPRPSEVKSEDIDRVIPGTDMTKDELNEKVMSQLVNYKMACEGKKDRNPRLLKKRNTVEENNMTGKSLEKSVTFKDNHDSDLEPETGDLDMRDSGHGSQTDLDFDCSDIELDDDTLNYHYDDTEFGDKCMKDTAVGTDSQMFYPRRNRKIKQRPPWRYWGRESAPELLEPMHEGPYRVGPFEEPMTPIPWQLKTKTSDGGWASSSMANYTDYLAKSKQDGISGDFIHMPKPPGYKPPKQGPGKSVSEALHSNMSHEERLAQLRLDSRRRKTKDREAAWDRSYWEAENMKAQQAEQHRQRVQAQNKKEDHRYQDEIDRSRQLREAKRAVNQQVRDRIEGAQHQEWAREEQRQQALQARRARREDIRNQREVENEEIKMSRQNARRENVQAFWNAKARQSKERDAQEMARNQQAHAAKMERYAKFQKREDEAIRLKQLQAESAQNKSAVFSSRIFP